MSQPKRESARARGSSPERDRFDVWFWRFVQVVGVVLVLGEAGWSRLTHDSPRLEVMAIGLSMMLGARGVERVLRAWRG